ncbi:MAG: 50S ribosomal protein L22 [Bacteroidota bacterium]|nr:50S ribosomal protein L22 [Candidatus Kapabacteria bacterium]MCS7302345.1 50S ribosomal protein L22 [Candidatus Kapabacteria bacterium]MCX7936910.1 50S ribosomal protein L22 [Chlorobiota bacterium]MDW8075311.1 50S ribosomal protein L22 [Bacteroidota bacterium]MDW8271923.1 50S ribosomal protein L22 [Bacteroidota bacterium]
MEARAIARYVRSSPRKMRLVIDLIRGKSAAEALALLRLTNKRACHVAEMTLRSALANLQAKADNPYLDPSNVMIKQAYVDNGPMLKRIQPAPMGRAYRIRKRSHHLTIVVETKD